MRGIVRGGVLVDVKTNHGLRCAKRLRVRWQQTPLFNRFTSVVLLHHHHEKAMPRFATALVHFPYGARPESGVCCHCTLRRPRRSRPRSREGRGLVGKGVRRGDRVIELAAKDSAPHLGGSLGSAGGLGRYPPYRLVLRILERRYFPLAAKRLPSIFAVYNEN